MIKINIEYNTRASARGRNDDDDGPDVAKHAPAKKQINCIYGEATVHNGIFKRVMVMSGRRPFS